MKLNKQMRFFFALLHVSVSEVLSVIMNGFRHNCVCVCEYHWPGSDMGDHLVLWLDDEVEHEQHGGHWRHCWVHVGSTVFGQMCVFFFLVCKTIDCLICASKISLYCSYGDISCHVWHYIAVLLNVSEHSAIPHSFIYSNTTNITKHVKLFDWNVCLCSFWRRSYTCNATLNEH